MPHPPGPPAPPRPPDITGLSNDDFAIYISGCRLLAMVFRAGAEELRAPPRNH